MSEYMAVIVVVYQSYNIILTLNRNRQISLLTKHHKLIIPFEIIYHDIITLVYGIVT